MMTKRVESHDQNSLPCPRRSLSSWAALERLAENAKDFSIRDAFRDDPKRFEKFHSQSCGILLDYSKQPITSDIKEKLLALAEDCELAGWRSRMFGGETINESENRAVLHTALRSPAGLSIKAGGEDISLKIHATRARMKAFSEHIRQEKRFRHIVNIGIGGSDLGSRMANEALKPFTDRFFDMHYVSNLDPAHLSETLRVCDPSKTLFIVTSKTFTTQETMMNALHAKAWLDDALGPESVCSHFVAVTQNVSKASKFGLDPEHIFPMWDWVGGRYSLWSAVGLPLCISIGFDQFQAFLDGAHEMDRHFLDAPFEQNLPVLLALVGIWNRTFLKRDILALLPYSQLLDKFPAFIQQLDMESNGKSVGRDGRPVSYPTGPIIFGEAGTNGQHAFYQLFHQGTTIVPCEFIGIKHSEYDYPESHKTLLANVIGQTKALMDGQNDPDAQKQLDGNRPSVTLMLERLDPRTLGSLIALYEHKVFTQGIVWNINSFDQWGVELGKTVSGQVLKRMELALESKGSLQGTDSSTQALIDAARKDQ